jgi:hypothetical protein
MMRRQSELQSEDLKLKSGQKDFQQAAQATGMKEAQ